MQEPTAGQAAQVRTMVEWWQINFTEAIKVADKDRGESHVWMQIQRSPTNLVLRTRSVSQLLKAFFLGGDGVYTTPKETKPMKQKKKVKPRKTICL